MYWTSWSRVRRPPCLYVSASQSSRGQVSSRSELRHSRLAAPRRGGLWSRDCQAVVRLRPWRARAARNALRRTRPPTRAQPAFASALYTSRAPPPCPAAGTGGQSRTEPRGRRGQSRGGSWKAGVAFGTTVAAAAPRRATTSGRPSIPRRCHRPGPKSMPRNATSRNHPPLPDLCHQRSAATLARSFLPPSLCAPLHSFSSLLCGDQCLSPSRPSRYAVSVKPLSVGLSLFGRCCLYLSIDASIFSFVSRSLASFISLYFWDCYIKIVYFFFFGWYS